MAAVYCHKCGAESTLDSLFCMKCGTRQQSQVGSSSPATGSDRDSLIGQLILEYKIESKLGEGGMGAVYLARHDALDQEVAIKILNPVLARDRELVERFIQEARIQVSLRHPNIVSVLTAVTTGPRLVLIMEYVGGISLEEVLERRKQLALDEALHLFRQVLDAVGYAHARGVVHRDIKPANLMIQADGTAKVMDFGIAKVLGAGKLTQTGTSMGSAHYMAPEQILGRKDLDKRADIYSLGVTLFQSLTGRVPFNVGFGDTTDSDFLVKQAHVQTVPPDPRTLRPEIPDAVAKAVLTAMNKDPAQRFQSCAEFAQALVSSVQVERPAAAPPNPAVAASVARLKELNGAPLPPERVRWSPSPVADARSVEIADVVSRYGEPPLATLQGRFWAAVIDGIIVMFLAMVPVVLLARAGEAAIGVCVLIVYVAYHTRMLTDSGQTYGKRALGIKVVDVNGSPLSSGKALGRSLSSFLLNLVPGIGGLIDIVPIFLDTRKCFHDYFAGTKVVQYR